MQIHLFFGAFFLEHFHVFVGDLAAEVDSATLKNAFAQFGEISLVFCFA